jgi:hypothetical protein
LAGLALAAALFWSTAYNTRHHGYYAVFPAWVAVLLASMLSVIRDERSCWGGRDATHQNSG